MNISSMAFSINARRRVMEVISITHCEKLSDKDDVEENEDKEQYE